MARSLQVQPEEHVTTSPLLIGFLLLAGMLLTVGMVAGAWSADDLGPLDGAAERAAR